MEELKFILVKDPADEDLSRLSDLLASEEDAPFISVDRDNYRNYVTSTDGVTFYKVYRGESLAAALQCEVTNGVLYLCVAVLPRCRREGIATAILTHLQRQWHGSIEAYVDERNVPSVKLFQKAGFTPSGKDGELALLVYNPHSK